MQSLYLFQDYYNAIMENLIRTYSLDQLAAITAEAGQSRFRAKQLYEWLHKHHALSYEEMTNLPKAFRDHLESRYPLPAVTVIDRQVSQDGTRKYVLQLSDGALIETVGIPSRNDQRLTVCVSSQVGCPMACQFCATGKEGFTRNLNADEITNQITVVERDFQQPVSNVVVMGQGEPFLNYENLLMALKEINNSQSFNIGARHITVSTCGILEGIEKFAKEPFQFTLAISLHSAIQSDRDSLMPRVKSQPLDKLKQSLQAYIDHTNRRITFEYLLIKGINDSNLHLAALKAYASDLLCHINLLSVNNVDGSPFKPPAPETVNHWSNELNKVGIETTIRHSKGADIDGACGQLKNKLI